MTRTVIVGDVHGCSDELQILLDRVGFTSSDRLVFVGDLVARGPNSRGVLDIARRNQAQIVRGNHEDRLLSWHWAMAARARGEFSLPPDLNRVHLDVVQTLTDEDWELLQRTHVTLFMQEHSTLVVHAGLVPGVSLDSQDPATMMSIRSIGTRGEARDRGGATPWGARWIGPPHVIFGHAASLEPQIHPWATGIDTGCVYGGYLTAMVLRFGEEPPPAADRQSALVSVPARRRYFEGGAGVNGRPSSGDASRVASGPGPRPARRRSRWGRESIDGQSPHRRSAGSGRGSRD